MAKKKTKKKSSKKENVSKKELDFSSAFKYPFNRPAGMLNILWLLLPIIGWFPFIGYMIRIVQNFVKGDFKELPTFEFSNDFKLGFFMFLKAIPFYIVYSIILLVAKSNMTVYSLISLVLGIFVIPMLTINFIKKQTVESYFELGVVKSVIDNFGDYIIVFIKTLVLMVIFGIMTVVLVGIPALIFTEYIFLADFYRRKV